MAMTPAAAAERLGVEVSEVVRLIRTGRLDYELVDDRPRVSERSLDRYRAGSSPRS